MEKCLQLVYDKAIGFTRKPADLTNLSTFPEDYIKPLYEILQFIEEYNKGQVSKASTIQDTVNRSWTYLIVRELDEYQNLGKRRRPKLVSKMVKLANKQNTPFTNVDYVTQNANDYLKETTERTRRQIANSKKCLSTSSSPNNSSSQHTIIVDKED